MPGMELERISLSPGPVRGTITVSANAPAQREGAGQPIVAERARRNAGGAITRTIPVGWDAAVENAKASMLNGVLTLVIPKVSATPAGGPSHA